MSELFPDLDNSPSGWNTNNHYFYEIYNSTGEYVHIKLAFSSKNMNEVQLNKCSIINDNVSLKQGSEKWQWWTAFQSSKISIPADLDKTQIYKGLDSAFQELLTFEKWIRPLLE
jgi:hypothetical protein